jgi:hypothetical protein
LNPRPRVFASAYAPHRDRAFAAVPLAKREFHPFPNAQAVELFDLGAVKKMCGFKAIGNKSLSLFREHSLDFTLFHLRDPFRFGLNSKFFAVTYGPLDAISRTHNSGGAVVSAGARGSCRGFVLQ